MGTFPHPEYSRVVLQPAYSDANAYLFEHMLAAHEAHSLMLVECGIISSENAHAITDAVATIRANIAAGGKQALAYIPGVEDLFFRTESRIIELAGADFGGNLQIARSRNDLGHALERMAARQWLLDLHADLLQLRQATLTLAQKHLHTIMPGYTHTQPAQPVTFAHYLAGVLAFLSKDQQRIAAAYANMNESPLGAAAFTGTGYPIDRARVAELLGFGVVIPSTQHSIGAGDHFTDMAFAMQGVAIGLGRVTHDLLVRAAFEFNAIRIDDSFIQISSIMPQKRNPVVLEHLRARLSRALGYAQGVVLQIHGIPYGDTQDIEDEIMPPLANGVVALRECLTLYAVVFDTLTINEAHVREQAGAGFTTATELADTLAREKGLPFRRAHHIASTLVRQSLVDGVTYDRIDIERLQSAARTVLGQEVDIDAATLQRALDTEHFVDVRSGLGGVAAQSTAALLEDASASIASDELWLHEQISALANAETLRREAIDRLGYSLTG
jgi:argininosuccinate lyase